MTEPAYNVLFICTGNSARSIMAEAILSREGKGRFRAFSAGSRPRGGINPHAAAFLADLGYDVSQFRSKSWDEFAGPDAPEMDFIFTVCDDAAGEECPVWPGHPAAAHWGVPDPAAVTGTPAEIQFAFDRPSVSSSRCAAISAVATWPLTLRRSASAASPARCSPI